MGDILSRIEESYEGYEELCNLENIEPHPIRKGTFYEHAEKIIKKLSEEKRNEYKEYWWYNRLK